MSYPCDIKMFYDTEFEAVIAAAKLEYKVKAEIVPYRCGTHWHLTNKNRRLRGKHPSANWCAPCKRYVFKSSWDSHVEGSKHRKASIKKEDT